MSGIVLFNSLGGTVAGATSVDVADPLAASFSTGATSVTLTDVKLDLYFDSSFGGSPTGSLTVSIDADASTTPGATIATLETIEHNTLPASAGTVDVSGFTPVVLAANTRYWIDLSDSDIGVQWDQTAQSTGTGVAGEYTGSIDSVTSNIAGAQMMELTAACYAEGTRILTTRGEVPIEDMRPGDRVPCLVSGRLMTVRWLGNRSVDCRRHPSPEAVMPIEIAANAFGPRMPARTLRLSRDHALYIDGLLVPVRHLVDGETIVQRNVARMTYWHLELDAHDAVLAEGLPAETYLDTGNRAAFANAGTVTQATPEFARSIWDARAAAPLVEGGLAVARIRARLKTDRPKVRTTASG